MLQQPRFAALFLVFVGAASAFAPLPTRNHGKISSAPLSAKAAKSKTPAFITEINHAFGILVLGSILAFQVPSTSAASPHGKGPQRFRFITSTPIYDTFTLCKILPPSSRPPFKSVQLSKR